MKILVITASLNKASGIGRYSKAVADGLRECGESVETALFSEPSAGDVKLEDGRGFFSATRNAWRLRRAARKADVVHALDAWPFSVYALVAVIGTRKKLFISGVGTYSVPPKKFSIKRMLMLAAYGYAEYVFSISAFTQQAILERLPFKKRASIVHLATTPLPKARAGVVADVVDRYAIPPDAKVVLSVGAIKDRKGQRDTLRGVLMARKRIPELLYVMVGDDRDQTYVSSIRKLATEQKAELAYRIVSDARSDEDLSAWYSLASVFALNSNNGQGHFEGFGLVFLEAAQFGLPGIGSRDCGIEDAIEDGVTGVLTPQRDAPAIAAAIEQALKDRGRMSIAAIEFAKKFSWDATVEAYREAYYT